jgi:hypothetical protein
MEQLHTLLAWLAAFGAVVLVAAAVATATGRTASYLLLDRAILAQIVTLLAALISGLVVLPASSGPKDALHFLYAAVALVAAPLTRYVTRSSDSRRMGRWSTVAALVVVGAVARLFMTGR